MKKIVLIIVIALLLANKYIYAGNISLGPIKAVKNQVKELSRKVEEKLDDIFSVTQIDLIGDFANPGGGEPPTGVYEYGPVDLVEVKVGSDDECLYLKVEMASEIPCKSQVSLDGTKIGTMSFDIALNSDQDTTTGCPVYNGSELLVGFHVMFEENKADLEPFYFSGATGVDIDEETRFSIWGSGEVVSGGVGHNFVVLKYKLSRLGLSKGMTIDVESCSSESESEMWHHYSFDVMNPFTFTID